MRTKVYFAGSIRGGRQDAGLYAELIGELKETCDVLTEHVGKADVRERESGMTDGEIFERDAAWIRECDLLIAECTRPSLGVGYELAYAESLGKPCAVLFRPGETNLSAMIAGNPYFRVRTYREAGEAVRALREILADFGGVR
ncbi:MAG: nucleoside 2-deoxyribosyltransferase [Clostridia bacterium]|nr:nucleoside 2-deoxyribosyltransferase [Clostridia bacterium]